MNFLVFFVLVHTNLPIRIIQALKINFNFTGNPLVYLLCSREASCYCMFNLGTYICKTWRKTEWARVLKILYLAFLPKWVSQACLPPPPPISTLLWFLALYKPNKKNMFRDAFRNAGWSWYRCFSYTCLWCWFLGLSLSITKMSVNRICYFFLVTNFEHYVNDQERARGQTPHIFLMSKPRDAFPNFSLKVQIK